MTANLYLERSFYGRQPKPAWHNEGVVSLEPRTAEQALTAAPFYGAFGIELRPSTIFLNGTNQEFGSYGIVRLASIANPKEHVFHTCTDRHHPLQPIDVARAFDKAVGEPVETLLFLGEGEKMILTWKLPSYEVKVGDFVDLFGTVAIGFDTKYGAKLFTASVRTVCQNTFMAAQSWADKNTDGRGKGNIFSGKAVNDHLLDDLEEWMEYVQTNALHEAELLKSFFGKLAETPIQGKDHVNFLLHEAYPNRDDAGDYGPATQLARKQKDIDEFNEKQEEIRVNIAYLYEGAGTAIDTTYWGLFNAGTEFLNYWQPSKKSPYASIMIGNRANEMKKLALALAENA